MGERRELTPADPIWEWWHKASLASDVFPLMLDNGAEVYEIVGGCKDCQSEIEPARSRVELRNHDVMSYWMRIASACERCRTLHINTILIEPDGEAFMLTDISDETSSAFVLGRLATPVSGGSHA